MNIVLIAFVNFLLAGAFLVPKIFNDFSLPESYFLWAPITMILLSMAIQLLSVPFLKQKSVLLQKENTLAELNEEILEGQKKQAHLGKSLHAIMEEKKALLGELTSTKETSLEQVEQMKQLKNYSEQLKTALKDSQLQLKRLQEKEFQQLQSSEQDIITLLSLLQQKGRFLDFVMDDLSSYPDSQIGAAARIVHQGCHEVLKDYFTITPVRSEREGSTVAVQTPELLASHKFSGKTPKELPYQGTLLHKGWLAQAIDLPKQTSTLSRNIIMPAEIEL